MPALADPTTWRTHPYGVIGYLFILKPTVVFRARVNMTIDDTTYPVANVEYDGVTVGAASDTKAGMTVLFGTSAGADDLGRNRLRQVVNASRVRIGISSRGSNDGEVDLVDDAYITVLDDYRVWWKTPRYEADGTQYMDYRIGVRDFNDETPPVANAGVGYAGTNDTVEFSSSASFATATGASIASRSWNVDDGTITVGSSSTEDITVEFPAGFRWVALTVTDTNGKTHTTRVPVYVEGEGSGQTTFTNFNVTGRSIRDDGSEFSFTIRELLDPADYPDGSLVMYWEEEWYGDTQTYLAGPDGREHMKFIGWMDGERTRIDPLRQETTITCIDVAGRLRKIPGFPFLIAHDTTPEGWNEMNGLNVDRYMHFLLHWNTTALEVAPFTWSGQGSTYVAYALDTNAGTPFEQVSEIAEAFCYKFTCDSRGQLMIVADQNLQDTEDRDETEIVTLTPDDYTDLNYEYTRPPRVGWLDASAVKTNQNKVKAILVQAPGKVPGQGPEQQTINHRLVTGKSQFRIQEGNRYARLNSRYSDFTLRLLHPGDAGIEPALGEWIRVQITDFEGVRGRTVDARFLVKEVSYSYGANGTKECNLTLEIETSGAPAELYREQGDTPDAVDEDETIFRPNDPIDVAQDVAIAVTDGGYVFRTFDFNLSSPTWALLSVTPLFNDGATSFQQFEEDPFSPYYLGTGSRIDAWAVTEDKIYRVTDITGAFTVTAVHTFANASVARKLAVSKLVQNHVAVMSSPPTPTAARATYTTDGSTFTTVTVVSTHSFNSIYWHCGCWMSEITAGKVFVTAQDSADSTKIAGYFSTDYGATWTKVVPATHKIYFQSDHSTFANESGTHCIVPLDGYDIVSFLARVDTAARLIRANGTSSPYETDITPVVSTVRYGPDPVRQLSLGIAPATSDVIGLVGMDYSGTALSPENSSGDRGVFWSEDGGQEWATVVSPGAGVNYRACRVYSDLNMIIFGKDLAIGLSERGNTVEDKKSNMIDAALEESLDLSGQYIEDVWRKR